MPQLKKHLLAVKAPLKKYVEINRQAKNGRRIRSTMRVYTNPIGETFTVKRDYSSFNKMRHNETIYSVSINHDQTEKFASAIIEVHPKKYISHQDVPEIHIRDVGIHLFHKDPKQKKGRGVFGMVVDECKQIGQKEFHTKPYYITLKANVKETQKYYENYGFELIPGTINHMRLKIN